MIPYFLAENNKGIYIIPKKDLENRKVARKLRNGTEHESEVVNTIIKYSGEGTVVHAGAYIGDMIPAISKNVKSMIAFEPNREAFKCAICVRHLNNCNNTGVYNVALSERCGVGILNMDQFRNAENVAKIKLIENEENAKSVTIDSLSIDKIGTLRYCSVIHLDVELHEIQALKGAIDTIKRDRPLLIVEDLYNTLNKDLWFKRNILNSYDEIRKIGLNRVYKCVK